MPTDNRTWTIGMPTIYSYPGYVGIDHGSVSVGGTSDVEVHFSSSGISDYSNVTLHVKGYDPGIVSVESTSVQLDSSGNGTLVIQGVSVGSTQITVEDAIGGEDTAGVDVVPPGVISTGSETQGVQYNSNDMPGFTFSLGELSLTPVTIDYNTLGSTLPSSLMGNLLAGSVTIDAGDTSKFVPFTVPDDGKIAPTRVAVVTLVVPGDTKPASKQMAVLNTDLPSIAIDGEQYGSDVDVDTDDDDSGSLATVGLNVSYDGTLNSTTFTWNPSQDVIWLIDQVGILGLNDLASLPGTTSDIYGDYHTWPGKPPADLYAQAIGGSPYIDGTSMDLQADVAEPATSIVAAMATAPYNIAEDTQSGVLVVVSGSGMVPDDDPEVAGQILVGSRINVTAVYVGPPAQMTNIQWTIKGASTNPTSATAIAGYNPLAPLPSPGGHSTQVTTLSSIALTQDSVYFYFTADGNLSDKRKIEVNCIVGGVTYDAETALLVWTPSSQLTLTKLGTVVIENPIITQGTSYYRFGLDFTKNLADYGITYSGSVTLPPGGLFSGGNWNYVQTSFESQADVSGNNLYVPVQNSVLALDNVPGFSGYTYSGSWFTTDGEQQTFNDGPESPLDVTVHNPDGSTSRVRMTTISRNSMYNLYIVFQPSGSDSIPVYLRKSNWGWAGTAQYAIPFFPPIGTGTAYSDPSAPVTGEVEWGYVASPLDFQFKKA